MNAGDEEQNPKSKITNLKFYKTGDRARYLPDGNIEFLGRADTQVKIRGFRVEPSAIESILAQHPQVADAALIDHTDPTGNQSLVAYVVVRDMENGRQGDKVTRWQGERMTPSHPVTQSPCHDCRSPPIPPGPRAGLYGAGDDDDCRGAAAVAQWQGGSTAVAGANGDPQRTDGFGRAPESA